MHEYSIIASLTDRVDVELARHPGARPRKLHVAIGELAGVDVPLLVTAFEVFRERTSCRDAELLVEETPARWCCPRCDAEVELGARLRCARCEVPARLTQGDEILLRQIEMEVPDV